MLSEQRPENLEVLILFYFLFIKVNFNYFLGLGRFAKLKKKHQIFHQIMVLIANKELGPSAAWRRTTWDVIEIIGVWVKRMIKPGPVWISRSDCTEPSIRVKTGHRNIFTESQIKLEDLITLWSCLKFDLFYRLLFLLHLCLIRIIRPNVDIPVLLHLVGVPPLGCVFYKISVEMYDFTSVIVRNSWSSWEK